MKIKQKIASSRLTQQMTYILLFVHLSLSVFLPSTLEHHVLVHRTQVGHAAQHSTAICSWVCSALTFVHSAPEIPHQALMPSFERQCNFKRGLSAKARNCVPYIRGPPAWF